jgi:DNA-binding NarL/FixJ family response regulator
MIDLRRCLAIVGNDTDDPVRVTSRELQIIESLVHGWTAREVAVELGISWHTVRTHIRNIYEKVGVSNRVELVHWKQRG